MAKLEQQHAYDSAYTYLVKMLEHTTAYNFKQAVFTSEKAYLNTTFHQEAYEYQIEGLLKLCRAFIESNKDHFLYVGGDKAQMLINAAVFQLMTDTLQFEINGNRYSHLPFRYDFEDFSGLKDWRKMFVTKLLQEGKGNCHSLPYLYKILVEELGGKAYLALAPNHMYIKQRSDKIGMYNTELSSASFPIDAWLMASGYIHLEAIRNGLYMEKLSNEQTIAFCLYDLAKGYERNFGFTNSDFIEKCLNKSLQFFPNNVFALLSRAEMIKRKMEQSATDEAKKLQKQYEQQIVQLYKLGYRKIPDQQYLSWMMALKEEERYLNKKVMNTFNSTKNE